MDYTIDIDDKNKVVLCTCRGVIDVPSARSMVREVRKTAFDLDYGVLYDVTRLSLGVSISDAYFFPRDIENIYEDLKHSFSKAAIVYKADEDFWDFFETTARNAGLAVSLFREPEEALEWISGKQPS